MNKFYGLMLSVLTGLVAMTSFATTTHAAPPTCVANMLSGVGTHGGFYAGRPLKVVLQRQDSLFVGYGNGGFSCQYAGAFAKDNATSASSDLSFEFSDRVVSGQDFIKSQKDYGTITVNQSTGAVTINLFGVNFGPVVPSCSGNVITYSTNGLEFWSITFGPISNYYSFCS
jgi:hypothetical protein